MVLRSRKTLSRVHSGPTSAHKACVGPIARALPTACLGQQTRCAARSVHLLTHSTCLAAFCDLSCLIPRFFCFAVFGWLHRTAVESRLHQCVPRLIDLSVLTTAFFARCFGCRVHADAHGPAGASARAGQRPVCAAANGTRAVDARIGERCCQFFFTLLAFLIAHFLFA